MRTRTMYGQAQRNPEAEIERNQMTEHNDHTELNGDTEAFREYCRQKYLAEFQRLKAAERLQSLQRAELKAEADAPHIFRTFCEKHGGNPRKDGSRWLLPDGAVITEVARGHVYQEPSPYPLECLAMRKRYHN